MTASARALPMSTAMHNINRTCVDIVQNWLDDTDTPPLVKAKKIVEYALAEGIAVYINATADLFFIHPSNRSRLLLD